MTVCGRKQGPIPDSAQAREECVSPVYKPIDQYGLIGDMNSAALVGTDGSNKWCCFPRFDSPSVLAAILDDLKGGRFQIAPVTPFHPSQAYLPNTNILVTSFTTATCELTLTDFMPVRSAESAGSAPHEIHRIVRCTKGSVNVRCVFKPSHDYGRARVDVTRVADGVTAHGGNQTLTLCSEVRLDAKSDQATAEFSMEQDEQAVFVLAYGSRRPQRVSSYATRSKFEHTRMYWEVLASEIGYDGRWSDEVVRSFLLLQLMIFAPTGAVTAAPTTSLPGAVGGSRNWDYRYSWLCDSSFTMDVLFRMGQAERAERYQPGCLTNAG